MGRIDKTVMEHETVRAEIVTRCSVCDAYGFSRDEAILAVYNQMTSGRLELTRRCECRHVAELAGRFWTFVPGQGLPLDGRMARPAEALPGSAPLLGEGLLPLPDRDAILDLTIGGPLPAQAPVEAAAEPGPGSEPEPEFPDPEEPPGGAIQGEGASQEEGAPEASD